MADKCPIIIEQSIPLASSNYPYEIAAFKIDWITVLFFLVVFKYFFCLGIDFRIKFYKRFFALRS